jgi:hypothetical protein
MALAVIGVASRQSVLTRPLTFDMEVIVRRQDQGHRASITCMIRHYVPEGRR